MIISNSQSLLPILKSVFFLSGFSAIVYQIAWQRLLTVYYGVGSISIALIVTIYMFGLGIGGLLGGFLAERINNKLRLYFWIELAIGGFGFASIPLITTIGIKTAGSSHILSFFYMSVVLLLPTILMGTTLPLLTKILSPLQKNFIKTISHLYFLNTFGASLGALIASAIFISLWGLDGAVSIAATINLILAVCIYCSIFVKEKSLNVPSEENFKCSPWPYAHQMIFLSGFLAIGYEIIWVRLIGTLVKSSPYAFSSVLAIYLLGIAIGSLFIQKLILRYKNIPLKDLFLILQFGIGLSVAVIVLSYYYLTLYTPFGRLSQLSFGFNIHPPLFLLLKKINFISLKERLEFLFIMFDVILWPFIFVFVPTLMMGGVLPIISRLALVHPKKEGQTVGMVYFVNIMGNVLGGLVTAYILLSYLGTETTLLIFIVIGTLFGIFIPSVYQKIKKSILLKFGASFLFITIVILFPKNGSLYLAMHSPPAKGCKTYFEEGVDTIVVTRHDNQYVENFIGGMRHGGRPALRFYYMISEACRFIQKPENALIIGFGTGSTTDGLFKMNSIKQITVVELSPTLLKNLEKIPLFQNILSDSRIKLVVDDGRRFLLQTKEKFDIIATAPLLFSSAYSNNIFSKDFFDIASRRLTDRGILLIWTDQLNIVGKTFMSSFPYARIYQGRDEGFLLGSNSPITLRNTKFEAMLLENFTPSERDAINNTHFTYIGDQNLKNLPGLKKYPINQDLRPTSEYFLGIVFRNLKERFEDLK